MQCERYISCSSIFADVFDDLACDDESDNRRHKGGAAGDVSSLGAFVLCTRRAYAVRPAGYRHIFKRAGRLFFRINDLEFFDLALAALDAHNLCKRTDLGIVNIRHTKSCGIEFVACTHTAYYRDI